MKANTTTPEQVEERSAARIDDYFVERHEQRRKLNALLDNVPADGLASPTELRSIRRKARRTGSDALSMLVDIYLSEESRRSEAAFLVLSEFPESQLQPVIAQALQDKRLPHERKLKLIALNAFECERDYDVQNACELAGVDPAELIHAFTQAVADMLEPEEIGLMWLQDFWAMPPQDKVSLIEFFVGESSGEFLPALELEAFSPYPEVRRIIARSLGRFAFAESRELAIRLLEDRDTTVRYDAQQSLAILGETANLPYATQPSVFEQAFCLGAPAQGMLSLIYSVRDRRRRIKFFTVLVDTWNRGILDVWGNVGISKNRFGSLISEMSQAATGFGFEGPAEFRELSREHALYLLQQSEQLSRERRRPVPVEFRVWQQLYRHEAFEFDAADSEFRFGLKCDCCGGAILANRRRSNLFVGEKVHLCKRCFTRTLRCNLCGRKYRLSEVHDWNADASYHERTCESCLTKTGKSKEPL